MEHNYNDYRHLIKNIPFLQGDVQIKPILKGYSTDGKFFVIKNSSRYLLKMFNLTHFPQKEAEFKALLKLKEYGVKCSRPVTLGELKPQNLGYMILSYIHGNDASEDLPVYSGDAQYQIGLEAGKELLTIHQYHAPETVPPWFQRKVRKHKRYVESYFNQDVRIPNDSRILKFIDDHLDLMKNRPNQFQHDDYHVGNLIVNDRHLSGIIDFNRFDWGDPIHDFLKVGMFSSEVSIPFSIGQIHGYHQTQEPGEDFWVLYSLYLAMSLISSVVWIQKVKPDETYEMMKKMNRVLEDHGYFEHTKPRWYRPVDQLNASISRRS